MQDEARLEIKKLKIYQNTSYREIADYAEIKPKSLYAWIRGEYNLGKEKYKRILSIIDTLKE